MKCPTCNYDVPEGSQFCINCGSLLQQESPAAPQPSHSTQNPYGNQTPLNPTYVPKAQPAYTQTEVYQPETTPRVARTVAPVHGSAAKAGPKLPWSKILVFAGAALALVLIAVLVINLVSGGVGSPVTQLQKAAEKTVEAGSFTFEIKVEDEKVTGEVEIDFKKEDITVVIKENDKIISFIYDGHVYSYDDWDERWTGEDISSTIKEIFKAYEKYGELKNEDLEKILDELDLLEDVEDVMNVKKLDKAIDRMTKKSWLKENAGYTTEREDGETLHIFEINAYDLLSAGLDELEGAFEDEDDYDELKDSLRDSKDYIDETELEVTIGVKKGYLSSVEAKVDGEKIRAEITDVGETKIDTDELKKLAEGAYIYNYDDNYSYDYDY